ncbi:MAG: hypothetical protein J6W42_05640 [Bacteroidaceae bacterium]|nr:hypothetical protein [Bacteroidaceae bacterium]
MTAEKMAYRMVENGKTANGVWKGPGCLLGTRKFARLAFMFIAIGWLLTGCVDSRLSKVEQLMDSDLLTADSLIYSMDVPTGKRNSALYAMLKTQIDYKMYRDITNDSLIRIATDYYGTKYKDYHAAMSWYSLGCVSGLNGLDSTAVDAYLKAMRLFNDTLVRYYALCEQNIAHIYVEHDLADEAMQMIKACHINAERLKDSAAIAFCEYNIANFLLYREQFDEAQTMFLELKDSKWLSDDSKDIPLIQLSKISQFKDGNYNQSIEYIDSFLSRNQHNVSNGAAYSVKADAYYGLNQMDSAQLYYHLSLTETTDPNTFCNTYRRLSEIQTVKGNKDSAAYYIKQANLWMDSSMIAYNPNIIYKTILNNRGIGILPQSRLYKHFVLPIIILTVVLIITGIALQINWYRERRKKKQEFQPIIDSFKEGELYKEMCDLINKQEPLTKDKRKEIDTKFHNSMNVLRDYIKKSGNKVNDMDIDYCIFTMLGFMQKDFHLFFAISHSGSRNLKMRLSNKLPKNTYKMVFD